MKEKRCEYCNKKKSFPEEANKSIISKSFNNEVDVGLEIFEGKISLWADNLTYYNDDELRMKSDCIVNKKINYCPMCGRKLTGKE